MEKGNQETNGGTIEPVQPSCYDPEKCLAKTLIDVIGPRGCQPKLENTGGRKWRERQTFCHNNVVLHLEKPRITPIERSPRVVNNELPGANRHSHQRKAD